MLHIWVYSGKGFDNPEYGYYKRPRLKAVNYIIDKALSIMIPKGYLR